MLYRIEKYVFPLAILNLILSFLGSWAIVSVILFLISMYYIIFGWKLFNPEKGKKLKFRYFLLGYSFSSVHMASLFYMRDYPLAGDMCLGAIITMLVAIILIALKHKPGIIIYYKSSLLIIICLLRLFM